MEVYRVIFDGGTYGITSRSLKVLRNALAERIHHRLAVVEIPTSDLCCGFLILDRDTREAVFTGDGFRVDGGGEGGAGYRSARALFRVFGLTPIPWEPVPVDEIYDLDAWMEDSGMFRRESTGSLEKKLTEVAREIAGILGEDRYVRPSGRNPCYVR